MTFIRDCTRTIGRDGKRSIQFPAISLVMVFATRQFASRLESNMPAEGKDTPQSVQPG